VSSLVPVDDFCQPGFFCNPEKYVKSKIAEFLQDFFYLLLATKIVTS